MIYGKHLLALGAATVSTTAAAQTDLVIRNVAFVDVETGQLVRDRNVHIADGRIEKISAASEVTPNADTIIDGSGKFLMPGLIDMHVHTDRDSLPLFLEFGVTTVRDMGTHFAPLEPGSGGQLAMRNDIRSGKLAGPEVMLALRILDGPIPRNPRWAMHYASIATPEQGRKLVDQVANAGGDFVKVYTDLAPAVFTAIAKRAKARGLRVVGHVPGEVGYLAAIDAGIRTVEHLRGIFIDLSADEQKWRDGFAEAAAERTATASYIYTNAGIPEMAESYDAAKAERLFTALRENSVGVVPTLVVLDNPQWQYPSAQPDPALVDRLGPIYRRIVAASGDPAFPFSSVADGQASFDLRLQLVGEMHRAGVDILAGTDASNPFVIPGISMHEELGQLVRAGLSNAEALRSATLLNARYLDAEERIGSIAVGKEADLILLGANPLEDIAATRSIEAVFYDGKRVAPPESSEDTEAS